MNFRVIAVRVGDLLKYDTTVNEIGRIGGAFFPFQRDSFPNDSITSSRAQLIYDWVLTLARHQMNPEERTRLLVRFCRELATDELRPRVEKILLENGVAPREINREDYELFIGRNFHPAVIAHAQTLFLQGNYFHAVFEVAKVYNNLVGEKARSDKDGRPLMLDVWRWDQGVLKITACQTETDKNVQDGIGFLSAGLMQAVRNPTAHEPAVDWPISKIDCVDILSFLSFLLRKLEDAVYFAR